MSTKTNHTPIALFKNGGISFSSIISLTKNEKNPATALSLKLTNASFSEKEHLTLQEIFHLDNHLSTRNLKVEIDELRDVLATNAELRESAQIKSILWDILIEVAHQKTSLAQENAESMDSLFKSVFNQHSPEISKLKNANPNSPVFVYLQNKEIL